jgi:hypothetical protein
MLEHLISDDLDPVIFDSPPQGFTALDKATPEQVIDAQAETAQWLEGLGLTDTKVDDQAAAATARNAFAAITNGTTPANIQTALTSMKTPVAVQRLVGMLTAYDWEFVQQAKEIRGYTVAKLLEETESSNANIRLKALGLLGKVTEVGLFTEKVEIKKTDLTEDEIDRKLKEKLAKFMGVTDASYTDVEEKPQTDDDEPITDA